MSRGWSRGRGQSVSLPLDTLFKESANRPSASRSAGTVGKWGITSFTSIRNAPSKLPYLILNFIFINYFLHMDLKFIYHGKWHGILKCNIHLDYSSSLNINF